MFQVLKEWSDVESVLIDDFLEKGNEQVLFLLHNLSISEGKGVHILSKAPRTNKHQ